MPSPRQRIAFWSRGGTTGFELAVASVNLAALLVSRGRSP